MTPELQVVDLQVLHATATLAPPPIAYQDLTVQRAITVAIEPAASVLLLGLFHETLAVTLATNASCWGRGRNVK